MSRIFFSYSRTDKSIVDDLIQRLEAAGHQVWLDRGGIRGGEQWREEIVEAIEGNDAFVLVLSKNSTASDHVRAELDVAKEGRKRIIPIDIQPVVIPSSMKYQLAGLQRINMHADFEHGYQELLLSLGGGAAAEASPATSRLVSPSRDQSKTRNTAIWIGGIAALVILFILVGYQLTKSRNVPEEVNPQSITQQASLPQTEVEDAIPPVGLDTLTTLEELEPLLLQANIRLSEPEDEERTRSYFTGPDSAYHILAVATLKIVGERRFVQTINLDIVDKWYTAAAGSGYAERGPLDLEIVEESLMDAHNDYWGDNATSLEALLEPLK